MNSVQENKNELEAAVRYCESAISRAKATIESMEFRQQAASKAWHEQTGREAALEREVRELRERVNLREDQIAMLERRLAKHTGEKTYPFKEGDIYYVFNQLDGTWIESVWDDESERIHDSPTIPSHPHRVYFTVDQKNVLDKFNSESD
jgi:hypothetical protein